MRYEFGMIPRRGILTRSTAWAGARTIAEPASTNVQQVAQHGGQPSDVINVKAFGAIGTGTSHPASERFSTLAACQRVFPTATALSQELDHLAIQAAIRSAESQGYGTVFIPAGRYILSPPGLLCRSVKIQIVGAGPGVSLLLCGNCGAAPALSFVCPQLETGEGLVVLADVGLLGYNNGIRTGGHQNSNGIAHTSFQPGSRGLLLANTTAINITSVAFHNFDLTTDADSQIGNVWDVSYESCMFSGCNKGIIVAQLAPNAFEHMSWTNCVSANNNYGVFVNFTDQTQVGGKSEAGDVYLIGCSLDYNVLWTIFYLGGASNSADIQNVLIVSDCHLETSSHASGTAQARIFNDGNLMVRGCMGYEAAENPVGWITGTFFSRTSVSDCLVPGIGEHAIPVFYTPNGFGGHVKGNGNVCRYGGDVLLLHQPTGCLMEPSGRLTIKAGPGPIRTDLFRQSKTTLLPIDVHPAEIHIVSDQIANHEIGAVLRFVSVDDSVWSFKIDPGVTLQTGSTSSGVGGPFGQQIALRKIAPNVWLRSKELD